MVISDNLNLFKDEKNENWKMYLTINVYNVTEKKNTLKLKFA